MTAPTTDTDARVVIRFRGSEDPGDRGNGRNGQKHAPASGVPNAQRVARAALRCMLNVDGRRVAMYDSRAASQPLQGVKSASLGLGPTQESTTTEPTHSTIAPSAGSPTRNFSTLQSTSAFIALTTHTKNPAAVITQSQKMSTQRIEAQIEQICLGIERQKDVLKKLESSKSLLQQQLNAARDPVARLPVEIASEIFLQCLPPPSEYPREYPQPQARHAPQLFLNVCHNWTNIALSTPALWASIGIILPSTSAFESLSEMWLRRAGNHLLNISLGGVFDSLVAHPIQSHFAQLESLAIGPTKPKILEAFSLKWSCPVSKSWKSLAQAMGPGPYVPGFRSTNFYAAAPI
ncbi:hypothetical protein FB45DRAFT_1075742 [Roridomyces roridus]|uniref:F-box domain-containing protein n=1 Tax=Roridomyces roridus TaxID=1738132 RepID=A0AAD7CI98_9AGAR|nr:hypothetical protein FB45DRAFT_1075742 [Roridomyces roridus]